MKIFLFVPSKRWSYCGGAIVVIATTLARAIELAKISEPDGTFQEHDVILEDSYNGVPDLWVLDSSFPLDQKSYDYTEEVVLNNYNYA